MRRSAAVAAVVAVLTILVLANAGRLGYQYYTADDPKSSVGAAESGSEATATDGPSSPITPTTTTRPLVSLHLPAHPRVVFLGDGYAAGEGGDARLSYSSRASKFLGWNATIVPGGDGSGFLTAGDAGTLGERFAAARVRSDVDLVVVAGGTLDAAAADEQGTSGLVHFRTAATAVLKQVTRAYPDAQVLVIGPFGNPTTPGQRWIYVTTALEDVAAAFDAAYLSPALLVWLGPQPGLYFDADGHLTADGQARVALQMERAIAGLTGSSSGSTS